MSTPPPGPSLPRDRLVYRTGTDNNMAMLRYGPWWRRHKRAFQQYFSPGNIASFHPILSEVSHRFLLKLLEDPTAFKDHIR